MIIISFLKPYLILTYLRNIFVVVGFLSYCFLAFEWHMIFYYGVYLIMLKLPKQYIWCH